MASGNATKIIIVDDPANAEKVVERSTGRLAEKVIELTSGNATKVMIGTGGNATPVAFLPPPWSFPGVALDIDFANNRVFDGGPVVTGAAAYITTTRATAAYAANAASVYSSFSSNTPRITNLGLLTEEERTNGIRNNSMQGASAPSTLPTNWTWAGAGITPEVIGVGTENGVDYIDIRLSGTTAATSGILFAEGFTTIAASVGQTWTFSSFLSIRGGNFTNISLFRMLIRQNNSGGTNLANSNAVTNIQNFISSTLTRYAGSLTFGQAAVAYTTPNYVFTWTNGAAVDVTIRFGWPQMELGSGATSPIRTTSAAATRAADVITLATNPISGTTWSALTDATLSDFSATRYLLAESASNGVLYTGANTSASATNGTNIVGATAGSGEWSTGAKAAASADGAGRSVAMNNGTVGTDANTQSFPTTLGIGGATTATGSVTTRRFALWATRLANAQLQAFTA